MLCIVRCGGRAPVGGPLRGNRRVSGWLPESVVCFGGPPGSMGVTHTRPVTPTGVLFPAAVPGGSQPENKNLEPRLEDLDTHSWLPSLEAESKQQAAFLAKLEDSPNI